MDCFLNPSNLIVHAQRIYLFINIITTIASPWHSQTSAKTLYSTSSSTSIKFLINLILWSTHHIQFWVQDHPHSLINVHLIHHPLIIWPLLRFSTGTNSKWRNPTIYKHRHHRRRNISKHQGQRTQNSGIRS